MTTQQAPRRRHVFYLAHGDSNTKRCSRCGATRFWVKRWAGWTDTMLNGLYAPWCEPQNSPETRSVTP